LEYWLATKIYDVNNDTEVEVIIIFKNELESAKEEISAKNVT